MLHMPSPMLVGGASEDVYPLFLAKITVLATGGSVAWSAGSPTSVSASYRVKPAAAVGTMRGTSWSGFFVASSAWARIVQHALPSEAVFNALVSSGHEIYVQHQAYTFVYEEDGPYGVVRNGYSSDIFYGQYGSAYASGRILDLIRFDAATGKAWRSNPSSGSAETEYNFRT